MKLLFLLFLHLLFFLDVTGQTQYIFKRYSTDDGISHNLIEDIIQDSYGFIWLATSNGVTKFDGYEFRNYSPGGQNLSGIAGRKTYCLKLDKESRLWVGAAGSLQYFDPVTERFSENFLNRISEFNPMELSVMDIAFDNGNNPWIGTDYGLFHIDIKSSDYSRLVPDSTVNSILDSSILSLLFDRQGKLWIGGDSGISIFDTTANHFTNLTMSTPGAGKSIVGNYIRDIVEDEQGNIWLAAAGEHPGISKYDQETKLVTNYRHEQGNINSIQKYGVISIAFDENGMLWAATDGGLDIIDLDQNKVSHIHHDPSKANSLSLDIVMKVFKDKDHRMWIGTFGGLSLWDNYAKPFYSITTGPEDQSNLPYGNVTGLLKSVQGGFWVGMDGGGISYYDEDGGAFNHYQASDKIPYSLSSDKVLTMFEEGSKGLWIGFWNENLDFFNYSDRKFYHHNIDPINNSISDGNVFDILIDSKGRMWIATWDGLSLMYKEESEYTFHTYKHIEGDTNSLIFNRTTCIVEDANADRLFIGTNNGLSVFNINDESFENFVHEPFNPNSLYANEINDIYRDSHGNYLIGTAAGLNIYHTSTSELKRMIINDGIIDLNVQGILEDGEGKYWVSSKKGIHKISRGGEGWSMITFSVKDDLNGSDFQNGSKMIMEDGFIAFGAMKGITYFKPEDIKSNPILPEIYLKSIDLYENESSEGGFVATHSINLLDNSKIRIDPKFSMFTINFLGLTFTIAQENTYKYKLTGFHDYWHDNGHETKVTYTNLEPGEYIFELMVANSDGIWNPEPKQLVIEILPKWYQTNLASVIFGLFIIFTVYLIGQIRTRNLKISREKLKKEVALRTNEIELKNKELDKANILLDQQIKEIEAQNEEITSQLESILEKSDQIEHQNIEINKKNKLLKKANKERKKANQKLRELNTNMEKIIDEQTRSISSALDKLQKTDQELNTLLYRSSHDLKGPLTTLVGLSLLAKYEEDEKERLKFFDLVEDTSNIMIRNLKKLQDVHQIQNNELNIGLIDLEIIKTNLIEFLSKADKNGGIKKEIEIENPEGIEVKMDSELLRIALENISENSVYFKSGNQAFIRILFKVNTEALQIYVEDNGLGLAEEKEDKIFQMFYRGKEKSKGAGLGLYTAKMAINKLNGSISFSNQDMITKFTIKIPLIIV